jgi:UDPglucose 6-dehydrogenase
MHKLYDQLDTTGSPLPMANKKIAILGLSFKPNTDDIRESPAIDVIEKLHHDGAIIQAYDPKAMDNMQKLFPYVTYCTSAETALANATAAVLLTEWDEFKTLQKDKLPPIVVDTRHILKD